MSKTSPLLMASGEGGSSRASLVAAECVRPSAPVLSPAAHTLAAEDFRNSRREGSRMSTSAEFIQINLGIPYFFRFQGFVPSHLATRIGRSACHHAGQRRFSSFRRLIVELSTGDTLDEGLLFFGVGKFQVGSEVSGYRK